MSKLSDAVPASVNRDAEMIETLRANPEYAEVYLQTALKEIYEEGGVPAFLTALRRVIEARGVDENIENSSSVPLIVSTFR